VPIRDVRALAQAMSDAPGRDELSAAAMRKAAAQFTIERSAGIYLEVLAATAAESAKAPQFTEAPARPQTA
jgi:hypothetical protein